MQRPTSFPMLAGLFALLSVSSADETVTVVAPATEAAEDLDLKAVGELFKDSKNLEEFEKSLNDSAVGVNNLDLDSNGEVDFIRVVEEVKDETHVVVLQVPMAENEFQDVATIEVEKTAPEKYNLQLRGNETVYGPGYYVAPSAVHIHTWPLITWIYRPGYRPYRSVFVYRSYPPWRRPYVRVAPTVYRTRTVVYSRRAGFTVVHTNRVLTVHKVSYHPRHSKLVRIRVKTHHGHHGHGAHKHRRVKVVEKRNR